VAAPAAATGSPGTDPAILATATQVLRTRRVAVMIVAFDAERHIAGVLERIPVPIRDLLAEVFVLDDHSGDATAAVAEAAGARLGLGNFRVFRTPSNRGYGGNQKVGYTYAIERGFDFVVMLHGDGQYAPEELPRLIAAFASDAVDVVLGSRMLRPRDALRGGMPLYKWLGNRLLTRFENWVLGVDLAEFHTGYRGFRVERLRRIPFRYASDDFHFDTEILIQFLSAGGGVVEIPVPTHYGDEVCHVNGLRYAWDCARSVIEYRLFRIGLFYNPLLDFDLFESESYYFKRAANSLHQHVLARPWRPDEEVLDFGAAGGYIASAIAAVAGPVCAVDLHPPRQSGRAKAVGLDLDGRFDEQLGSGRFDTAVALDVLEHLESPEQAVERLGRVLKPGGRIFASTANVAFFVTRLMLLLGSFNYGKRGVLDLTHKRLFTVASFRHLFITGGFMIEEVRGFGPPIRDLVSSRLPFRAIDSLLALLAHIAPRLFAYQILLVGRRRPSLEEVYRGTVGTTGPASPAALAEAAEEPRVSS
jgi:glycosyltransferase involved in cell wall biosynthesis